MTEQRHGWLLCEMFRSKLSGHSRNRRRKSASVQRDPFGSHVKTEFWELSCKSKKKKFCRNHLLRAELTHSAGFCTSDSKGILGWLHQSATMHDHWLCSQVRCSSQAVQLTSKLTFLPMKIKKLLIGLQNRIFFPLTYFRYLHPSGYAFVFCSLVVFYIIQAG